MTDAKCPTCDAAKARYAERHTTAWTERERALDAANAKRRRAWAAADAEWEHARTAADNERERTLRAVAAESDRVLAEHPHHAEAP